MDIVTDVSICSNALTLIGVDGISSFLDETREAAVAKSAYSVNKKTLLQVAEWRFSVRQEKLSLLEQQPLYDFEYAYQLPSDFLRFVGKQDNTTRHQIFQDKVYTNLKPVLASFQYDIPEKFLPAYFITAFQYKLASLFSLSLKDDTQNAQAFDGLYQEALRTAKFIDSQNNTNSFIPSNSFSLILAKY